MVIKNKEVHYQRWQLDIPQLSPINVFYRKIKGDGTDGAVVASVNPVPESRNEECDEGPDMTKYK